MLWAGSAWASRCVRHSICSRGGERDVADPVPARGTNTFMAFHTKGMPGEIRSSQVPKAASAALTGSETSSVKHVPILTTVCRLPRLASLPRMLGP